MRRSSVRTGFLSHKLDGFRAVAYVEGGACRLVSRNRNAFKTFEPLAQTIAQDLAGRSAILDGEIMHPGPDGRPMFYELMRRRGPFCFYAFDLLWLDGRDLRDRPLLERKRLLRKLLPRHPKSVLYVDHVANGLGLFQVICDRDMEGVVAKQKRQVQIDGILTLHPSNPSASHTPRMRIPL